MRNFRGRHARITRMTADDGHGKSRQKLTSGFPTSVSRMKETVVKDPAKKLEIGHVRNSIRPVIDERMEKRRREKERANGAYIKCNKWVVWVHAHLRDVEEVRKHVEQKLEDERCAARQRGNGRSRWEATQLRWRNGVTIHLLRSRNQLHTHTHISWHPGDDHRFLSSTRPPSSMPVRPNLYICVSGFRLIKSKLQAPPLVEERKILPGQVFCT